MPDPPQQGGEGALAEERRLTQAHLQQSEELRCPEGKGGNIVITRAYEPIIVLLKGPAQMP